MLDEHASHGPNNPNSLWQGSNRDKYIIFYFYFFSTHFKPFEFNI